MVSGRFHLRLSRRAFTLIELLVVIVILGILMAVALPTFLAQQKKAQDSSAQQYLVTAWKSARAEATSTANNVYPTGATLVNDLAADEPQLNFVAGTSSAAAVKTIAVDPSSTATNLILYTKSASGDIYKLNINTTAAPDATHMTDIGAPVASFNSLVLADGASSYWRMSDASGSLTDSGSGGLTMAASGTPTYGQSDPTLLPSQSSTNKAISFDGTSSYFTSSNSTADQFTGTAPFSVEAVFKWVSNGSNSMVINTSDGTNGWSLEVFSNGNLQFQRNNNGTSQYIYSTITSGNWYDVVAVYDGTTMHLYVNGTSAGGSVIGSNISQVAGGNLRIGAWARSSVALYFSGLIDELAVYPSALSSTQVSSHYTAATS